MRYAILALAACAPLAACNQAAAPSAPADTGAAVAAVKGVEDQMLAAFKARDAAKAASFYTADAEVMVPFAPVVRGSDAAKSMGNDFKDPAFSIDFTNTRTEAAGDMAFTHGTFRVTYTNPATKKPDTMQGSYVTVFRKQADGSWKAVQDISSPGAPSAPPQDAESAK